MTRCLPTLASVLLFLLAVAGQEPGGKPNTLSPKEATDGWLLLFDGDTSFGWKTDGSVKVEDGSLLLGGDTETLITHATEFSEDLVLEFAFRFTATPMELPQVGCYVGRAGQSVRYFQSLPRTAEGQASWRRATFTGRYDADRKQHETHLAFEGLSDKGSNKSTGIARSGTTIAFKAPAGCKLWLRDVRIRPMGLKSIFNGKDLAGWKEVKTERTKSVYSVTDKGELNVKNGPGDLQTEGQWDDFILQMDIISNGKHLNSGVFFRALPGEFWSGYEAQVRNQWQGDDRTKPVDFGTGGLYNRQPARKVVSTDKEWFTMTVIANGNHLATWVNGYPVADFTDSRPANRSARNGSKTDTGVISLQGHDPTTDLSFRNIRIAGLPKGPEKKP